MTPVQDRFEDVPESRTGYRSDLRLVFRCDGRTGTKASGSPQDVGSYDPVQSHRLSLLARIHPG